MSCCKVPVSLSVTSRTGNGSAQACVVAEHEGRIYQTVVDTHTHANGSWTETTSITGGPIINGEGSCGDVTVDSTFDPEFDYGARISVTTEYFDEVDLDGLVTTAQANLVYGGSSDGDPVYFFQGTDWFADDTSLAGPASAATAGETSTATVTQVKFHLGLYAALGATLVIQFARLSDDALLSQTTVVLSAGSPDSDWIDAPAAASNDGVYVAWVALRVPPYTTTSPALP